MSTDQDPGPVETGASAAPTSTTEARLDALAHEYGLTRDDVHDVVLRFGFALEVGVVPPSDAPVTTDRVFEDVLTILVRHGFGIDDRTLGLRIEEMATECGITPEEVRAVLLRRGLDACEQFHAQLCPQDGPPETQLHAEDEEPATQRWPEAHDEPR